MMMVPEAWENQPDLDPDLRAFYEYHSGLMEPWDGPAAIVFSDGSLVGATLDRNGLRPGRWLVTTDGLIVLASETGVLDIAPGRVARRGRLRPGKMFLVDTVAGRIIGDDEIKSELASSKPWGEYIEHGRIRLADLPEREHIVHTPASVQRRQRTFGYTDEEVRILLAPMGEKGAEPLGAMGSDTPIAILSKRPRLLFDYFVQQFAQVTNPPLDSIREEVVTSLKLGLGPERNLLASTPEHARQVVLDFPVIDNDELAKLQHIDASPGLRDDHRRPRPLPGRGRRARARGPHRRDARRGRRGDRARRGVHRALRPRLEPRARAGAEPADDLGDPPPPDPQAEPDEGRPDRRGRRRARGAPRRAADRLRRLRGEPVPRDGVGRAARPRRARSRASRPRRPSRT